MVDNAPLRTPTEDQWDDAEAVKLHRAGWSGNEWTNHHMAYNLRFFAESAHTSVLCYTDKGEAFQEWREGMLVSHFDIAMGDEQAGSLGFTVTRMTNEAVIQAIENGLQGDESRRELRKIAKELGVKVSGTSAALIARIEAARSDS